jgi:hypothetical protein
MNEVAQVKAAIPRDLKRKAFAALALRDEKFNRWLATRLEELVRESTDHDGDINDERNCHTTGLA